MQLGQPANDISSPPLSLHCANARAFGLTQCIEALAEVTDSAEKLSAVTGKATKPAPKRRKPSSRYRSYTHRQSKKTLGFAKGTGYGGQQIKAPEWEGLSATFLEKAARSDAAAAYWFSRVRAFLLSTPHDAATSWSGFIRPLLRRVGLLDHIAKVLGNESIMDVGDRVLVYVAVIRVVHALIEIPCLRGLVTDSVSASGGRSIVALVLSMSRQAALLATGAGLDNLDANMLLLCRQIRRCVRAIKRHDLEPKKEKVGSADPQGMECLDIDTMLGREASGAERLGNGAEEDTNFAQNGAGPSAAGAVGAPGGGGRRPSPTDLNTPATPGEKEAYADAMRELQFETVPGLAETSVFYQEALRADAGGTGARGETMRRVATEVASLSSSLPLYWSSTIVLRVDEGRYDFLQALITGPDGSPYSCGCFVFDIYLPPTYPNTPPKFRLLTTGGGRVRFNPNLYNCGKVCLSLLGTWAGPTWTKASTLLQVLVSIQSLILVDDPYFNEPGYEATMGTEGGKAASKFYNAHVRRDNALSAMLANLRHPPAFMSNAILTHFKLKRRSVKHQLRDWFPEIVPTNGLAGSIVTPTQTVTSAPSASRTAAVSATSAHTATLASAPVAAATGIYSAAASALGSMAGSATGLGLSASQITNLQQHLLAVRYGTPRATVLTAGEARSLLLALDAL